MLASAVAQLYQPNGNELLSYETDPDRGRTVHLRTTDASQSTFIIGDASWGDLNPNDTHWALQGRRQLGLWVKNEHGGTFQINVYGNASAGYSTFVFVSSTGTDTTASWGGYVIHLGDLYPTLNDGQWHYVELDLGAWHAQFSGVAGALTRVNGLIFSARNLWVDDLTVAVGALGRSWQVIPGAAIRGVLGAQTGAAGAIDITDGQTQAVAPWGKYYYHYNDLGTVYATTTATGDKLGVYQPDHFGNYQYVDGLRPDTMGLTGKFRDASSALNYYGARWLDDERGRWMTREPMGIDGPNLYQFCFNEVMMYYDSDGFSAISDLIQHWHDFLRGFRCGYPSGLTSKDLINILRHNLDKVTGRLGSAAGMGRTATMIASFPGETSSSMAGRCAAGPIGVAFSFAATIATVAVSYNHIMGYVAGPYQSELDKLEAACRSMCADAIYLGYQFGGVTPGQNYCNCVKNCMKWGGLNNPNQDYFPSNIENGIMQ